LAKLVTFRIAAVAVIELALGLAARDAQLRRVHHHDVVAGVDVRRVLGSMLAAQAHGNLGGEATQHLVLGIDHHPLVLEAGLRGIGFHAGKSERVRILHKKMARPLRVAPNPPKEEGGGDRKILPALILLCNDRFRVSQDIGR
jgi:hypothetical protein